MDDAKKILKLVLDADYLSAALLVAMKRPVMSTLNNSQQCCGKF